MSFDSLQLGHVRNETRQELLTRQKHWKSGSPQNVAATVELARRDELTNFTRFWVGFSIVALSLILGTVVLIRLWW